MAKQLLLDNLSRQTIPASAAKDFRGKGALLAWGQQVKTGFIVLDRDLLTPPGSPAANAMYLLPASGTLTGAWAAFTHNSLAVYQEGAWTEIAPEEGWTVDIIDEDIEMRFDGSAWGGGSLENDLASTEAGKGASLIGAPDAGDYYAGSTVLAQLQEIGARFRRVVNIDDHEAAGDAKEYFDGAATSSDATFTSASNPFSAGDVGKSIAIYRAAAAGDDTYTKIHITTIEAYNGAGSVELADAPTASISGAWFVFGTDDSAALTAAVEAVNDAGGAELRFTSGKCYWVSSEQTFTVPFSIEADGATIFAPALDKVTNLTIWQTAFKALFRMSGKAYNNESADPANLTKSTTLAADATKGVIAVEVADASGIGVGDLVVMTSDEELINLGQSYPLMDVNIVTYVDVPNDTIGLANPIADTMTVSGQTVTVKTYALRRNIRVNGGRWVAAKYYGDQVNGGGQNCFYFQMADDVVVSNATFDGWSGYPVAASYAANVTTKNCKFYGKPAELGYVEGDVSVWYGVGGRTVRNFYLLDSYGERLRHIFDAYMNSYSVHVKRTKAVECRTSAFTTHEGCYDFLVEDCEADHCYTGIAPRAQTTTIRRCVVKNATQWGFLQTGQAYSAQKNWELVVEDLTISQLDENAGESDAPSTAMFIRGPFTKCHIDGFDVTAAGAGDGVKIIAGAISTGDEFYDSLILRNGRISHTNAEAAKAPLTLGGSTGNNAMSGIVENIDFDCPDNNKLVDLYDGSSGAPLANLHLRNLRNVAPSVTASAVVTKNGSNYASSVTIANTPLAIGSEEWRDFTIIPVFGTAGDSSWNVNASSEARWRKRGALVDFAVRAIITPTHSTASGGFRIDDTPFIHGADAAQYSFPVFTGNGNFTMPAGCTQLWARFNAQHDYFLLYATGSATAPVEITAAHFPSGTQQILQFSGSVEVNE